MWQSFVCAMTAAVVLQAADPFRSGKLVLYQVTYSTGWHAFELIPFALLGIIGVSDIHYTFVAKVADSFRGFSGGFSSGSTWQSPSGKSPLHGYQGRWYKYAL